VFVPGKPFQPSLMFSGKARAYPKGLPGMNTRSLQKSVNYGSKKFCRIGPWSKLEDIPFGGMEGNQNWNIPFQVNERRAKLSESIRTESAKVFSKIRILFQPESGDDFFENFEAAVAAYRDRVKGLPAAKQLILVRDPTKF